MLWEEKSAAWAADTSKWVGKHITGKFHSYLEARKHLPGYENAPIGFRFSHKPGDLELEIAIVDEIAALRRTNQGTEIRIEW